jgi:hypothetical protein
MQTNIFHGDKLLCTVDLESVYPGTFVIEGVSYTIIGIPTYVIGTQQPFKEVLPALRVLQYVNIHVTPI